MPRQAAQAIFSLQREMAFPFVCFCGGRPLTSNINDHVRASVSYNVFNNNNNKLVATFPNDQH